MKTFYISYSFKGKAGKFTDNHVLDNETPELAIAQLKRIYPERKLKVIKIIETKR